MRKVLKYLNRFEDIFSCCFLVVMCVSIFLQIIARIVFKRPLIWTEEVSRYSYIWCVFLCISMGEHYSDHFCVDIFLKSLKGRFNQIVYAFEKAIIFAIYVYVFFWSVRFFDFQRILVSPALGMPMSVIASSMVVGFFMSVLRTGIQLVSAVKKVLNYEKTGEQEEAL